MHCLGWVSSAVFSRDGESVAFHYRVARCAADKLPPLSFVYTIGIDGKNLWRYVSRLQPVVATLGMQSFGCILGFATCFRHCCGGLVNADVHCSIPDVVSVLWQSYRACRVPMVDGRDMDFGHDGKLLVCDGTGTYLVDNR